MSAPRRHGLSAPVFSAVSARSKAGVSRPFRFAAAEQAFVEPQANEAGDHAYNRYQHQNLPLKRARRAPTAARPGPLRSLPALRRYPCVSVTVPRVMTSSGILAPMTPIDTERTMCMPSLPHLPGPARRRPCRIHFRYGARMGAQTSGLPASDEPDESEIAAALAAHEEWVAAGCPGARSHEDVMAELLGLDQ